VSEHEADGGGRGGSGFGVFLLGVVAGVALGVLFAPDTGDAVRGKVRRRLRGLGEQAREKAEQLGEMVADAAEDLEQRRARRAAVRRNRVDEEEDEPLE